jgi:hypothetical protein
MTSSPRELRVSKLSSHWSQVGRDKDYEIANWPEPSIRGIQLRPNELGRKL